MIPVFRISGVISIRNRYVIPIAKISDRAFSLHEILLYAFVFPDVIDQLHVIVVFQTGAQGKVQYRDYTQD